MKYFVFLFLAFVTIHLNAQIVDIPDTYFKGYLLLNPAINTNGDAEIQVSEAEAFSDTIDLTGQYNIRDLIGIGAFKNAIGLKLTRADISEINFPEGLSLEWIGINNLSGSFSISTGLLENLKYLELTEVSMSSLDITENFKLEELILYEVPIYSLDLSKSDSLKVLEANSTNLLGIDMSNLYNIESLLVIRSLITDLNITNSPILKFVRVVDNALLDSLLIEDTKLNQLTCDGNPQLRTFHVSSTDSLWSFICYNNFGLEKIILNDLHGENLSSFILNENVALKELRIQNSNVRSIYANDNSISQFSIENCPNLTSLLLLDNNLEVVDVSSLSALTHLHLDRNNLVSLNVANGSNAIISYIGLEDNIDLSCVQVDDPEWSEVNWSFIPEGVSLSTDCSLITSTDAEIIAESKVIGYYNTLGQKVDSKLKDQLVLIKYSDGSTKRVFRY